MTQINRRFLVTLCLAGAAAAVLTTGGCSGGSDGMQAIQGTVTIDGQSATEGTLSFEPISGASATSGATFSNGQYKALVPIGEMRVRINAPKVVGERKMYDTPDSPVGKIFHESLPAKYNTSSELTIEISNDGENEFNFDLITK